MVETVRDDTERQRLDLRLRLLRGVPIGQRASRIA
jgi:hypothetical protein